MTNRQRVVRSLEDFLGTVVKTLTAEVTAGLLRTTPVDTGHARSNWIPSIGKPAEGVDGSRESVSYQRQQQGLTEVAVRYRIKNGTVYVTNNVHYVPLLNEGSSVQAPAGFVETTILQAAATAATKLRAP